MTDIVEYTSVYLKKLDSNLNFALRAFETFLRGPGWSIIENVFRLQCLEEQGGRRQHVWQSLVEMEHYYMLLSNI